MTTNSPVTKSAHAAICSRSASDRSGESPQHVLCQVCRRLVVERVSEREKVICVVLFQIGNRFDFLDDFERSFTSSYYV
jgi:hypothetical protein